MKKVFIFTRLLYLILAVLSFYLLLISRSGEVYTVWQLMHPMFIPIFFATTALLVAIILSSETIEYKLLFIIIHSIISHSFFVIIFPAGNIGFQQSVLGITRRIFDNATPHGWGGMVENIVIRIYNWFGGNNFQSVYSVISARMFGVDVFWSHLLLAPTLWGIFVPTITFMITKTLGGDEKIAALAGLLGSVFPLLIYLGAISVPNSLGFIFFLASLYFFLKYLTSPESKYTRLMLIFTFASFLSHFLTGFISLSFLILALSLKRYETDKIDSPSAAKIPLFLSFILSTVILPFVLVYHRIFSPLSASFSLDTIYEYTTTELLGQFLLGEYLYYPPHVILIYIAGPLIAFIWAVYKLYTTRNQKTSSNDISIHILFFFLGYLMLCIDYRILKMFMINVPFNEERIWMFRALISVPLVALAIKDLPAFFRRTTSKIASLKSHLSFPTSSTNAKKSSKASTHSTLSLFLMMNILIPALLAGWITVSVYYAYPHFSPLQTTSYELEAVKYIDETTNKSYVVICDVWMFFAGQMIVGDRNPRAYYFHEHDPLGVVLFTKMKDDPSPEVAIEAMNYTNVTVAYFIITKEEEFAFQTRLGETEYNHIIQQAQQNNLQTYKTFSYGGEEKLRIFYHQLT